MKDFEDLYRMSAYDEKREIWLDLVFKSIDEAKRHNPHLTRFSVKGIYREKPAYKKL